MRFTKSFLVSLNLHIWGIGLLSVVWVLSRAEKPPEPLEVKFFKIPREAAAVEGETSAPPELVGLEESHSEDRQPSLSPQALRASGPQKPRSPGPGQRLRQSLRSGGRGQPLVTYRVKIARQRPDRNVIRRGMQQAADDTPVLAGAQASAPTRPPTSGHRVRRQSEEISFKGDTRPLIEIIQARIDAVTPLAHATAVGCRDQFGIVKIAFLIDTLGYPCGMRIMKSSGSPCLDDEVDNVLHLAEPYPYVAGWVPVTVRFTL